MSAKKLIVSLVLSLLFCVSLTQNLIADVNLLGPHELFSLRGWLKEEGYGYLTPKTAYKISVPPLEVLIVDCFNEKTKKMVRVRIIPTPQGVKVEEFR